MMILNQMIIILRSLIREINSTLGCIASSCLPFAEGRSRDVFVVLNYYGALKILLMWDYAGLKAEERSFT